MSNNTASEAAMPPDQKPFGDTAPANPDAGSPDVKNFISWWQDRIISSRKYHSSAFKKMQVNSDFVRGKQWPGQTETDDRYVVNLAQSEVAASVAALYAKNPTFTASRTKRMDFAIWDENPKTLQEAQMAMEQSISVGQPAPDVMALLQDVNQGKIKRMNTERIAKTLEIVFKQQIKQQNPVFKLEMKQLIRRVETHGVGFIKLDFQRMETVNPEAASRISDLATRLAHIQGLMKESQNGGAEYGKQAEELRISMDTLHQQNAVITTEGLLINFPRAPALIIDKACSQLRGFVGARFIAEEFHLSKSKIFEIYKVDVGGKATCYDRSRIEGEDAWQINAKKDKSARDYDDLYRVWEVYHPESGSTFTICEGCEEYLQAPAPPKLLLEQFYPYYSLAFNEIEDETTIYPPSTVELIRHQQMEFNRSKEALRQHRIASKPQYVNADGTLSNKDMKDMESAPAHAIIMLSGLQPGQKAEDLLQQVKKHAIDPNVYETSNVLNDIQLITRRSAINIGGQSNATATADTIAQDGRQAEDKSKSDELDDFLTLVARDAGTTLLLQMSPKTVQEIAGPGATWPENNPHEILADIDLTIEAGSSGAPNRAMEVATFQRLFPVLVQTPGIKPDWLAKTAISLAGANIDLTEAYLEGLPSIQAINAAAAKLAGGAPGGNPTGQNQTGDPATNPAAQGPQGANPIPQPPSADNQMTVSPGLNGIPAPAPGQQNIFQ